MLSAEIIQGINQAIKDNTVIRPEYFPGTDLESIKGAIAEAASRSAKNLSGINYVLLSGKHYFNLEGIVPQSRVAIVGCGMNTFLHANAKSAKPVISIEDNTEMIYLGAFQVDGERALQNAPIDGIRINSLNGKFTWAIDSYHGVFDVLISDCSGDGLSIPNQDNQTVTSLQMHHIIARNNAGYGFRLGCTDSMLHACISAGNKYGYYNNGGNNRFTACKSYWNTDTGFFLDSSSTATALIGCEAQEEGMTGLYLKDNYNVIVQGFSSDTHGHVNGVANDTGMGIVLDGCQNNILDGIQILNRTNLCGNTKLAFSFRNNPKNNSIKGNVTAIGLAQTTKPIVTYDVLPVTNRLELSGVDFGCPKETGRLTSVFPWVHDTSKDPGILRIDKKEGCLSIYTPGRHEWGSNLVQERRVSPGDKIGLALFAKVDRDAVVFVQINWLDAKRNYLGNSTSKVLKSYTYDWTALQTEAPPNAAIAVIKLIVAPNAVGVVGTGYLRNYIYENQTSF